MQRLSIEDMCQNIEGQRPFEAVSEDYSFYLKIESYQAFLCAAIHDGHQFRKPLWDNCAHSAYERWYEEDPETWRMIGNMPMVLVGLDSRFEYDLNRAPELAIYEDAWGKTLWKEPLTPLEKKTSLKKHQAFYKVVQTLIGKMERLFPKCIVYDLHSYNWQRWTRQVPTWNLGTENVDRNRFQTDIENWRAALAEIELPHGIPTSSAVNDTFFGNGHFLKFITGIGQNTLVLATEVAKIYCDETEQVIYPEVVQAIQKGLEEKIPRHAEEFVQREN